MQQLHLIYFLRGGQDGGLGGAQVFHAWFAASSDRTDERVELRIYAIPGALKTVIATELNRGF